MKKSSLLCAGILYACVLSAQPSFQTSLQAGISLPLNSNDINDTHAGKAIHFGNHLDYTFGNSSIRFGLGAYIGYINSIATDNKYKQIGEAIAEKYRFAASQLTFNSTSFKSTHILLGPVASFGSDKININIWAKGGYGLNEPSRYTVLYKENGVVNNVYVNQGGENKNSVAYNLGAGIRLAISDYVGMQLSAGYFSTQTDQVNYNFDREKGTAPVYFTAANQFIQASAGLQFTIGNPGKKSNTAGVRSRYDDADTNPPINARPDQKIKTKSNIKNDRVINPGEGDPAAYRPDQKIKTKSNIKNDRLANNNDDDADEDSLLFIPSRIELRSVVAGSENRTQLQAVDNYLTGFAYQSPQGAVLSQCGASAMPGEPIPGIDVKLKRMGSAGNDILSTRTNKDGSFAFNNIAPGDYTAEAGGSVMDVTVAGNNENAFRTLDIMGGSCSATKENFIISTGDKIYVEVIPAREAGSGMATGKKHVGNVKYEDIKVTMGMGREAGSGLATGKRMHKPYRVADTEFDINTDKIYSNDGKLYAEVIASREAGSGMASGRRSIIVTGDVDGDGADDYSIVTPRDAASGMPTGKRMHKPITITKELDRSSYEIVSPRDAASGLPTGKRMHKPFVITITDQEDIEAIVSPRDAASGMPTGRRQYQPLIVRMDPAAEDAYEIVSPRDAASGLPTGRRQYQPLIIKIDPVDDSYEVVSPRDAASGLPTGKRMHKPFVITKELDYTDDGDELVTYKIIHRDLAARNVLLTDAGEEKMAIKENGVPGTKEKKKGIITGKDNDTGMYTESEAGGGEAGARWLSKKGYDYYKASADFEGSVASNPLYEENSVKGENPLYQPGVGGGVNPMAESKNKASGSGNGNAVTDNPLYEQSGTKGENPLFEAKSDLRIAGSNGKDHHIFIPENMLLQPAANTTIAAFNEYEIGPLKWMVPESIAARKSINEKGIKRSEAAKGITEKGIKRTEQSADAERKGWDGSVKGSGKGINEAGIKVTEDAAARKGWDGTVKGGSISDAIARKGWDGTVKGGAVVESISRVRCADGGCAIEAIVRVDGVEYEAVITGVLKTKHDTVKNSISNVR